MMVVPATLSLKLYDGQKMKTRYYNESKNPHETAILSDIERYWTGRNLCMLSLYSTLRWC